jgi:hypothetical protein
MVIKQGAMEGSNRLRIFAASLLFATVAGPLLAGPIPPPEKLLSDDTLLLVTAPDFSKVRSIYERSPQSRFWNDPAMKPFKDGFIAKWNEEVVKPVERELDIRLNDYASFARGQVTFAVTQNGWSGKGDARPAWLLLIDAKEKSAAVKTNLVRMRKKWVESGKAVRTEKIRDLDFSILTLSSNDVPKTLKQFLPQSAEVQELGANGEIKESPAQKREIVLGQADSLLILGSSTKAIEKVLVRLNGGPVPALADSALYQANHLTLFRESPAYAWLNAKAFVDVLAPRSSDKVEGDPSDPLAAPAPSRLMAALGLNGLKTMAVSYQDSNEGAFLQFFLGAPEPTRQGLFKILAGVPKDCSPPPFVPADTAKFRRWRIDLPQTWASVEKMLNDISAQSMGGLNFVIDTAAARAKEKDPGYDLKKALLANLGDDIITCERAPKGVSTAEVQSPPSLTLLSSPAPEQLAVALKALFVIFPGADSATEREFLGHKIYSTPAPAVPLPMADNSKSAGKILSYAASGGYVALSTDASMLEEFLRSSESQAKTLRETAGLTEAAQKVTGPGTFVFGYRNQLEDFKARFAQAKNDPASLTNASPSSPNPLMSSLPLAGPDKTFKEWMDFSLLPPFERVSKYFHFTVYGGSASVDGLTLKYFAPTPPALKDASISAKK